MQFTFLLQTLEQFIAFILFYNSSKIQRHPHPLQNLPLGMNLPQQLSFLPSEINQHQYTTINDIILEDYQDDADIIQEGEMTKTQLSVLKPFYKELQTSVKDNFYLKFYGCIENLQGTEKYRYSHMQSRFNKFFIYKDGISRGERMNKKLQADYRDSSTFPLSNAIMVYGVDYLSNRDIKSKFGLPKNFIGIKRINWSNCCIFFQNKKQLEEKLKPMIFDKQKGSFFKAKQEETQSDQQQSLSFQNENANSSNLPRQWFGLRPYQHKEEYIFWFVRYLTSIEPQYLENINQRMQFMETYNASKKLWERRQKNKETFDSSIMNTSRYETIYRSRGTRSINGGSEPENTRQRSRQKYYRERMDIESQDFNVLDNLTSQQPGMIISSQEPLLTDRSVHQEMSFVYNPQMNILAQQQTELDLKKKSDQILGIFEMMSINCDGKTLESVKNSKLNGDSDDEDDDEGMEMVSHAFDPRGLKDSLFLERKNKISKLTELKPEVKFNYQQYVEKILIAEEENKDRNKCAIPVIVLD